MTDALADLLARVEAATGPDRDLDLAIWNALNDAGETWRWMDRYRLSEFITCDRYGDNATGNPVCSLDAYTASLDAAFALTERVLPGWGVELRVFGDKQVGDCYAEIWRNVMIASHRAHAPTPALALLAAILRAKMEAAHD